MTRSSILAIKALTITLVTMVASLSYAEQSQATGYVVTETQSINWFALEANIEAVNEATISAQTSGRIKAIMVDINDYVEKGQLLIQLRNKQQKAAFDRAQAQLKQAKALSSDAQSTLKRSEALFQQGGISKGRFDNIKAQAVSLAAAVKASQALLKQAKEQLDYTQIRAPYAGIVKNRHVRVGESVNPGKPVMTGLSLSQLRAVANIPQRFAPHLNKELQKQFQIIHGDQTIKAKKVVLFPYADKLSHSFKVRVEFDVPSNNQTKTKNTNNQQLFPGMWVKLNIPMGSKTLMPIPKSAVMHKGELSSVYVLTEKGPKLRQIRLGETVGSEKINVLAGLRKGETIALDAYVALGNME